MFAGKDSRKVANKKGLSFERAGGMAAAWGGHAGLPDCVKSDRWTSRMSKLIDETPIANTFISHDVPCHRCAYNLRGLPRDGRCPECGALGRWHGRGLGRPCWSARLRQKRPMDEPNVEAN